MTSPDPRLILEDTLPGGAMASYVLRRHERLRFTGVLRAEPGAAQMRAPDALQSCDVVAIDLGQWRVAAVVPIAAVGRPTVGRCRDEVRARECRSAANGLRIDSRGEQDERGDQQQRRSLQATPVERGVARDCATMRG